VGAGVLKEWATPLPDLMIGWYLGPRGMCGQERSQLKRICSGESS
jgi:hypothetical protein